MTDLGIRYLVEQDPQTKRWDIYRGGKPTGAFARDMQTAIGTATHEARLEGNSSDLDVSVWLAEPGKRVRQVWP